MRILIANDGPSAFYYIRLGYARVFSSMGHEVALWDINNKPAMDVFDEFQPDLFMGQSYNLNRSIVNAIKERPWTKVIMKAGDWGSLSNQIPNDYQILKASEQEKRFVLDLYNTTKKPDFLHIYYHPDYIDDTHGFWKNEGVPVQSLMLAADIFEYTNGEKRPEFESDITYVGGYWEYKAQVLNKYLVPLCYTTDYNIKIFGNSVWPVPQYCGFLQPELTSDALASATICPQLHEPHSQEFGFDMSERTFKLLADKCFVISDYVEGLAKLFNNDEIIFAKTPKEFEEKVDHYLSKPYERIRHVVKGFDKVIHEHTYFNRVAKIFECLNIPSEANRCRDLHKEYLKKIMAGLKS